METRSLPPHVFEMWTELSVGYHGGERDFTLRLELGDVLVNTPDRLEVTQTVRYAAPLSTVFARQWVTFVTMRLRRVMVDPATGFEIRRKEPAPDGEEVHAAQ